MALSASALAAQIQAANLTLPPAPEQLKAYCRGFIAMVSAGIVNHVLVNGTTAPGAPLSAGSADAGIIVVTPAPFIGESGSIGPLAILEHTAITTYVGTGLVSFPPGTITGNCTNTPTSPGPLVAGAGNGGQITGLTGSGCAQAVTAATGGQLAGPDSEKIYSAMMDYLQLSAKVTYATGTIIGICPPGGGPMTGGVGAGGTIS